jgi:DNA-binding NtrC family response regulator
MNFSHIPKVDSRALERLRAYDWPGNVRELQNIVERALILSHGSRLIFPDLGTGRSAPNGREFPRQTETLLTMDQAMANHIRFVLEKVGGQVAGKGGAAEILQINPRTLRFRMKKLGIRSE